MKPTNPVSAEEFQRLKDVFQPLRKKHGCDFKKLLEELSDRLTYGQMAKITGEPKSSLNDADFRKKLVTH